MAYYFLGFLNNHISSFIKINVVSFKANLITPMVD